MEMPGYLIFDDWYARGVGTTKLRCVEYVSARLVVFPHCLNNTRETVPTISISSKA